MMHNMEPAGLPNTNSLFMGMENNVTPIHFDDQENIFCQVQGKMSQQIKTQKKE